MQKIIIICGPTAVGKTKVGCELAKRLGGEIVSADSGQVWREFDKGTAKPSAKERADVVHHLIDIADPKERFDAARFVELADAAISDIAARKRMPFVVGGTGMYIKMLVHGVCDAPPRDEEFRAELEDEIKTNGLPVLHARLAKIDPYAADKISPNDHTRIIRGLEIYHLTGMPASKVHDEHAFNETRYQVLKVGLKISREELYGRINERVDQMIEDGLIDEARRLRDMYGDSIQPFSAVGYSEMLLHIKGELDFEEAVCLIKRNTRRLAKRQLTWFRADHEIRWFEPADLEAIANAVEEFAD
ncbi:MAG: tRNA (adenosine(37)-N6)-dimethylallyltransferase MiaA [Pseudomonadota bacterium]